ncbi:putative 3-methyladenine DNA glycosylase [Aureimonas sp. SA4125]|uniref:DNA-3-methyladenine glycosylase n=1 Tax=Aureimonas sp. SA4125 TaxID=2826993 RepID=UPI001CC36FFF|nr:DNA-3-methyladenine glycosylase [Aureimonas sp. SA4125]BDA85675.1 putative 3-methyladenine DNA glycosylase [Aureimonas sp. SA4125]
MLNKAFFARHAALVAPELIGVVLTIGDAGGIIVETEAYDEADPASHTFNGPTPRNLAMFGPPGHAYVYRSYGIHWCLNFVCGVEGVGEAVLIRAIEPTRGLDVMRERRGGIADIHKLCSGPGRLCQALGVDREFDRLPLDTLPFRLAAGARPPAVATGVRVGLTKGAETAWRFGWPGSRFLSRRFPPVPVTSVPSAARTALR